MSKSGIDTRSGLRKRSNSRPKRIGSRSVMVSAQATSEPAPEPRPGPPVMSCAFAHLIDVINRMNYAGSFLIVFDFIKWAKRQYIPVGHDQEVARIVHAVDDIDLEGESLLVILL